MTNEAKLVIKTGLPIPMNCDNAVGIAKGALLSLADLMTVALSLADGDIVGGIAGGEKIASDGKTKINVFRADGSIFRVIASGTISVGDPVAIASTGGGNNYTYAINNVGTISGARILGIALETAADEETYLMELKIQNASGQGVD